MSDPHLKPCPFCGGEARVDWAGYIWGLFKGKRKYYVQCQVCLIFTPWDWDRSTPEAAAILWNRRYSPAAIVKA